MLLKIDAAQLEWRVKVFLAQDKVGMDEIWRLEDGTYDIHTDNETRFRLPSRTIAKNWLYQAIFSDAFGPEGIKGAAGGFSAKADFQHVFQGSKKEKVDAWQKVLAAFFTKYPEVFRHGPALIREACETGMVVVPSGRYFPFKPEPDRRSGGLDWPRTKILNYPVQGFSADLVQVARLNIWQWWDTSKGLLINTVHDDVESDVDNDPDNVYNICIGLENSFRNIPQTFKRLYGTEINIPLSGEVKYGVNLNEKSMRKFKKETFFQDYKEYCETHGSSNV